MLRIAGSENARCEPVRAAPEASVENPTWDSEFAKVYDEHAGFLWRVLRGLGVREAMVADATQDVFMVVYRRLPDYDRRNPIRTWLFAIARRVASNYRRKGMRGERYETLDEQVQDRAPGPAEAAERLDDERLLAELLDTLDEEQRALVVLAEIEQLTVPEITAMTGIAPNTLYSRLRRARLQLCRALAVRDKRARHE